MTPRNTNTGGVLEAMVVPALDRGGYEHETQVYVGLGCGGGIHKADALARRDSDQIIVSLKWQQTGGTAEQKVPFEIMCLADAVRAGKPGWQTKTAQVRPTPNASATRLM
jgi:hypothetical protein